MLTYQEALRIVGGLSRPSKMPCPAWSLSQKLCKTGSKQAKHPGSVCSGCYAARGRYLLPNVRKAMAQRLEGLKDPRWVEAMVEVMRNDVGEYFRWFDSGDLQSPKHLEQIIEVAKRRPNTKFWLPTQEQLTVRGVEPPPNLTIRVTAPKVNPIKLPDFENTAIVLSGISKSDWAYTTLRNSKGRWFCPAETQSPKRCGGCRACWDKSIQTVAYRYH